jgi:hypothetical protein
MRENTCARHVQGVPYLESCVALKDHAAVMFSSLKRQWLELRNGRPGHRFRAQFERRKRATADKSWLRRSLPILAASILLLVGVALCLVPGPGVPLIVVGASVLAEQSRPVALLLDWLELKLRKVTGRGTVWWRQASTPARGATALLIAGAIVLLGYGAFYAVFRD